MITVATLRTRLVWLGGKDSQARICCVQECRAALPWRIGGRHLEVVTFDGGWRSHGAVCNRCAVAIRAYQFFAVDHALDSIMRSVAP